MRIDEDWSCKRLLQLFRNIVCYPRICEMVSESCSLAVDTVISDAGELLLETCATQ